LYILIRRKGREKNRKSEGKKIRRVKGEK